jgi:hypothetical protein
VLGGEELPKLIERVALLHHAVKQVRAVIAGGKDAGLGQIQLSDDVAPGRPVGGGGERQERHAGEALLEDPELLVLRAKIVAPLGDAMRLVNGEEGKLRARQEIKAPRREQPLGRDIKDIERSVADRSFNIGRLGRRETRVHRRRPHSRLA